MSNPKVGDRVKPSNRPRPKPAAPVEKPDLGVTVEEIASGKIITIDGVPYAVWASESHIAHALVPVSHESAAANHARTQRALKLLYPHGVRYVEYQRQSALAVKAQWLTTDEPHDPGAPGPARPRLTTEAHDKIHQAIDQATAAFIQGIPQWTRDVLSKSCLGVLGIRNSFRDYDYEVDTVNGREPPIGQLVKSMVQDWLQGKHPVTGEPLPPEHGPQRVIADTLDTIAREGKFAAALKKEAVGVYQRRLRDQVVRAAEAQADADAKAYVQGLEQFRLRPLIQVTALEHPEAYAGATGELVLERMVHREIGPKLAEGGDA